MHARGLFVFEVLKQFQNVLFDNEYIVLPSCHVITAGLPPFVKRILKRCDHSLQPPVLYVLVRQWFYQAYGPLSHCIFGVFHLRATY